MGRQTPPERAWGNSGGVWATVQGGDGGCERSYRVHDSTVRDSPDTTRRRELRAGSILSPPRTCRPPFPCPARASRGCRYPSRPPQPHPRAQNPTTPMSRREPSANDITSATATASAPHAGHRYPGTDTESVSTGHNVSPGFGRERPTADGGGHGRPQPPAPGRDPLPSAVVTGRGHRREQEGGGPPSEPHRHTRRPERTCGAPRRNTPTTSVRSGGQCIRFRRRRRRIPGSVPAPERSDPGPLRPGAEGRSVTRTGSGWGAGRRRHGTARRNVPSWRSPNGPRSRTRCHRRPDPQPADRGGLVPAAPGAGSRAA